MGDRKIRERETQRQRFRERKKLRETEIWKERAVEVGRETEKLRDGEGERETETQKERDGEMRQRERNGEGWSHRERLRQRCLWKGQLIWWKGPLPRVDSPLVSQPQFLSLVKHGHKLPWAQGWCQADAELTVDFIMDPTPPPKPQKPLVLGRQSCQDHPARGQG